MERTQQRINLRQLKSVMTVARERRRGDRPPSMGMDIYLVNLGRQGILCLLAVKNGVGVAT
jgi:hypothetical protein